MSKRHQTRILSVDPTHPDATTLDEAGAIIRSGGLVAFPTETVYGLGANALDAVAVRGIFAAKRRPSADPLIVHISAIKQLELVAEPNEWALVLAGRFWPGPLTLVLPKTSRVPDEVTAGLGAVGVRMPAHPVALALIRAAGVPIAAPSANLFSRPSPTTAAHVAEDLSGRIDLILDGGPTSFGLESTVLDLVSTPPAILRPGALSIDALREVLPTIVRREQTTHAERGETALSPGTNIKHYSPRADVMLFEGDSAAVLRVMRRSIVERMTTGVRIGLLLSDEDLQALAMGPSLLVAPLGSATDLPAIARRLFAAMRELDAQGADVIFTRTFPTEGIGLALRDRLIRAAEGNVIEC